MGNRLYSDTECVKHTCHFLCHLLVTSPWDKAQLNQGMLIHPEDQPEDRHSAWRGLMLESHLKLNRIH